MSKTQIETVRAAGHSTLPGSVSQVGTITKYELVNYFRSRRFFILLAIGLVISGIFTGLVAYLGVSKVAPCPPSTCASPVLAFYSFWWGSSITFVIVLSGIFFGGDAISGEFQNKTGYFLVGNPLRRSSIYIGKWLGALTASLIVFATYAAITVGNGLYYFGANVPYQFAESLSFSGLFFSKEKDSPRYYSFVETFLASDIRPDELAELAVPRQLIRDRFVLFPFTIPDQEP